jgi:integrase
MTLREVGDDWIASNPHKAQTSIARDSSILSTHVYPFIGQIRIDQLSRSRVQQLVNGWSGASTTIERQYKCLSALLSFALKNGWISRNPCIDINRPRPAPAKRHPFTPEEVLRLVEAFSQQDRLALWIFTEMGWRWGEVFGLRVGNIDLALRSITLDKGLTRDEQGAPVLGNSGSRKAKPRSVAITDWLADLIRDHIQTLRDADSDTWLFQDSKGGPVRYSNWLRRVWGPALVAANLDQVTPRPAPHDLRRFNITQLVAKGVDVRTIMNRVGQSSPQVTLGLYAQPDRAADEVAARTIEDVMLGEMSHVERTEPADSHGT